MAPDLPQPVLETERLILRPFTIADAPAVQKLAGAREVASTTMNIPHPYEDGMAEAWISSHAPGYEAGELATYAILLRDDDQLVGAIGLVINGTHARAELGYWIGVPYWNQGFATEAAGAMLQFGFRDLGLNRIFAIHLVRNPPSGRVMEKSGMRHEGILRQHFRKWGAFEDVAQYGVLADEWRQQQGLGGP